MQKLNIVGISIYFITLNILIIIINLIQKNVNILITKILSCYFVQ